MIIDIVIGGGTERGTTEFDGVGSRRLEAQKKQNKTKQNQKIFCAEPDRTTLCVYGLCFVIFFFSLFIYLFFCTFSYQNISCC